MPPTRETAREWRDQRRRDLFLTESRPASGRSTLGSAAVACIETQHVLRSIDLQFAISNLNHEPNCDELADDVADDQVSRGST